MASTGYGGLDEGPITIGRRVPVTQDGYPRSKRALDVGLGLLGLIAASPLMVGIRVAMLASGDRGGFLYRARRVGEGGTTITVFKVRTMEPRVGGAAVTARDDSVSCRNRHRESVTTNARRAGSAT